MKCPVCYTVWGEDQKYCEKCAWEFSYYLGDVTPEEKVLLEKRLELARKNWNDLQKLKKATIETVGNHAVGRKSANQDALLKKPAKQEQSNVKADVYEVIKLYVKKITRERQPISDVLPEAKIEIMRFFSDDLGQWKAWNSFIETLHMALSAEYQKMSAEGGKGILASKEAKKELKRLRSLLAVVGNNHRNARAKVGILESRKRIRERRRPRR